MTTLYSIRKLQGPEKSLSTNLPYSGISLDVNFDELPFYLQAAEPWTGYRHHAAFQGVLPAGVVVIVEALSGACLLAPALLLLRGMPSPNLSVAAGDSRDPLIGLPAKYCDSSDHHQVEEQQLRRCIAASSFMAALWLLSILVAGRGSSLARLAWLPVLPLAFAGLALSVVRGQADSAAALLALQAQMYNHEKA